MTQWWRNLNRYGSILYVPVAFIGFFGGGIALGLLVAALFGEMRHTTFSNAERLVCLAIVFLGWWAVGSIFSVKADPTKAFQVQMMLGWFFVAIAGGFYLASTVMGR